MGGEFGGEWIHVYVWLSPFAVTETITTLFFVNQLCAVLCLVTQSCLTVAHGLWFSRLLCPWGFSRQEYWSGLLCPPPGHLPDPGMEPRSPALQVDSLPSEPPGKPRSTRVGSLSLLQGIFPSQELNWGLLHCRWILYQLSYQNSPLISYESESESDSVPSNSLQPHQLYSPWNSPGQNTGVGGGSLSLLQGILSTQGSNPGLTHCRRILYQLSHKGSPLISYTPI